MTQGERIKEIRKSLGLTLEKFGEKIGMKKNSVSQLENGKNSVTEQVIKSICREYSVDYVWLTTGEGEMFIESDDDIIETIDRIMIGENEFHKNLFKTFARLDESELLALESIMNKAIEFFGGKPDE
ncbi:helix-turn-helix domain-containing protein [Eisenbergiella sp.]